jgi:glycogen phosphorylase
MEKTGIHVPTWAEPKMMLIFNKYLGSDWLEKHDDPSQWERVDDIADEELWHTHYWLRVKLINFIRECVRKHWVTPYGKHILDSLGGQLSGCNSNHDRHLCHPSFRVLGT